MWPFASAVYGGLQSASAGAREEPTGAPLWLAGVGAGSDGAEEGVASTTARSSAFTVRMTPADADPAGLGSAEITIAVTIGTTGVDAGFAPVRKDHGTKATTVKANAKAATANTFLRKGCFATKAGESPEVSDVSPRGFRSFRVAWPHT